MRAARAAEVQQVGFQLQAAEWSNAKNELADGNRRGNARRANAAIGFAEAKAHFPLEHRPGFGETIAQRLAREECKCPAFVVFAIR